jgi:adenylate cyclase
MGFEIERKFLVSSTEWQRLATGRTRIRQAYLPSEAGLSLRVRIKNDDYATLTIKSRESQLRRLEFEYPIPTADAEALMALRRGCVIEKVRHTIPWDGLMWEVDVFVGENAGLVVAEIELRHEHQHFALPRWLGEEVTGQSRYYNGSLAQHPYCRWSQPQPSKTASD